MTDELKEALTSLTAKFRSSQSVCNPVDFANRNYDLLIDLTRVVLNLGYEFEKHCEEEEEEESDESDERTSFGEWVKTLDALPPIDVPILTYLSGTIWLTSRSGEPNEALSIGDYWTFLPPLPPTKIYAIAGADHVQKGEE